MTLSEETRVKKLADAEAQARQEFAAVAVQAIKQLGRMVSDNPDERAKVDGVDPKALLGVAALWERWSKWAGEGVLINAGADPLPASDLRAGRSGAAQNGRQPSQSEIETAIQSMVDTLE